MFEDNSRGRIVSGLRIVTEGETGPPALHLHIGAISDLPPDGIGVVRVQQPLGDDALEIQPLNGPKEITTPTTNTEDR